MHLLQVVKALPARRNLILKALIESALPTGKFQAAVTTSLKPARNRQYSSNRNRLGLMGRESLTRSNGQ